MAAEPRDLLEEKGRQAHGPQGSITAPLTPGAGVFAVLRGRAGGGQGASRGVLGGVGPGAARGLRPGALQSARRGGCVRGCVERGAVGGVDEAGGHGGGLGDGDGVAGGRAPRGTGAAGTPVHGLRGGGAGPAAGGELCSRGGGGGRRGGLGRGLGEASRDPGLPGGRVLHGRLRLQPAEFAQHRL